MTRENCGGAEGIIDISTRGRSHRPAGEVRADGDPEYAGSMIGRDDKNGPQGSGVNEDVSFTLDATDRRRGGVPDLLHEQEFPFHAGGKGTGKHAGGYGL